MPIHLACGLLCQCLLTPGNCMHETMQPRPTNIYICQPSANGHWSTIQCIAPMPSMQMFSMQNYKAEKIHKECTICTCIYVTSSSVHAPMHALILSHMQIFDYAWYSLHTNIQWLAWICSIYYTRKHFSLSNKLSYIASSPLHTKVY